MKEISIKLPQLEKRRKQNSLFFMRLIILSFLFSIQFNCNAQNNKKFNELLSKFELVEWPVNFAALDREGYISKEEFNMFFNINPKKWKFIKNTYYTAIARIQLKNHIILIIRRYYETDGYTGSKDENVFFIFDMNGNIKSSIVVLGYYVTKNSENSITSKFLTNLQFKIITENWIYGREKPTIHSNSYKIDPDTGEIVEISK